MIWTGLVRQLNQTDHPEHKLALQTFVHELAHVHDLRYFLEPILAVGEQQNPGMGEMPTFSRSKTLQSEYSAQRRAAWAAPEHGLGLLEMLNKAMKDVDDQIRSARLSYRVDGDMDKYWSVVVERFTFLFQPIGYGLGHADWVEANADDHPKLATRYRTSSGISLATPRDGCLTPVETRSSPFFDLSNGAI